MDTNETQTCRLCFCMQNQQIHIFSDLEASVSVAEVINEHIGQVSDSDALPKTVCKDCWSTTETFHNFHRTVKSAQADYLKGLIKCELGTSDDVDVDCTDLKPPNFSELDLHGLDRLHEVIFANIKSDELDGMERTTAAQVNEQNLIIESDQKIAEIGFQLSENTDMEENPLQDDRNYLEEHDECESYLDTISISAESRDTSSAFNSETVKIASTPNFDCFCDVCNIDLKTLKGARAHYRKDHNRSNGYIKCCDLKFKHQNLVDDHKKWHRNPKIFKCNQCDKCMRTKKSLGVHISKHKHTGNFTCDYCGKTYHLKYELQRHISKHVIQMDLIGCQFCQRRFSNNEKLEQHERFFHNTGNADEVRKQLELLKEKSVSEIISPEKEQIIAKHFDMTCDICGDGLKSVQQAQFHYMHEHQVPNGYIKCCDLKFRKNQDAEGHILWHMDPEMLKCNICGKNESKIKTLKIHLLLHKPENEQKRNVCVECNMVYFRKQHYVRHMKKFHGTEFISNRAIVGAMITETQTDSNTTENDVKLAEFFNMNCDLCSVTLDSLHHAKMHYMDEHGIANGYIKCCNWKFKRINQVNDHIKYHLNPDIFKCQICGKNFPTKDRLSIHLGQHNALETKRYACEVCKKAFASKYELDLHRKTHKYPTEKTISCELCNRRFATEELQKAHQKRIHFRTEQLKTAICEICAKTFCSRNKVLLHIRSVHSEKTRANERVQCNVCEAWLSTRFALKDHLLRHTAEPQKCSQCDKVSPNQRALLRHIKDVHTEPSHKCHLCDKSFKVAVALKDHIATHTGEKLYKCLYCPESFIWRPNCYSHQKKAHPDEWSKNQKRKETLAKL